MGILDKISARLAEKSHKKDAVFSVYNALVDLARAPCLFRDYAIADTIDGRFDSIVLHIALFNVATRETLQSQEGLEKFGDEIIGVFLKDMDRNLREIGVGDLSVGKKVKKMASAYYGRAAAYEQALAAKEQTKALAEALKRNLYRGEEIKPAKVRGLAEYASGLFKSMKTLGASDIAAGRVKVEK